jgi:hypothetical protein
VELDPLMWPESRGLLRSPRYEEVEALLTEVLRDDGAFSRVDALHRAILQRDLCAVFDWFVQVDRDERWASVRGALPGGRALHLASLLAQAMQQLALSEDELGALPDLYAAALASRAWPAEPSWPDQDDPYLPPDLFATTGPWILLGTSDGSVTPLHDAHFQGRSVFSVHLRLPGGRAEGLEYLRRLREFPSPLVRANPGSGAGRPPDALYLNPATPQLPVDTDVALVRRAILFDVRGRLHVTRLIESVQIRRFRYAGIPVEAGETFDYPRSEQQRVEFVLDRDRLFAGESGGIRAVAPSERAFRQFLTHEYDPLAVPSDTPPPRRYDTCLECHGAPGLFSLQSYTRINAGMGAQLVAPAPTPRRLDESRPEVVEILALDLAASRYEWRVLRGLLAESRGSLDR